MKSYAPCPGPESFGGNSTSHQIRSDEVGLCGDCRHASKIESSHGSTFYLCRLSLVDPRYPKYPTLPVRTCDGYERRQEPIDGEHR